MVVGRFMAAFFTLWVGSTVCTLIVAFKDFLSILSFSLFLFFILACVLRLVF
ncbi:hypothetical protein QBC42DRAFT_261640 [Cladorrhinum samala]|uniref:Uncharacterized protein n=1 Tax=Cladorrhinum samala TaxID=585594 RepID=A0AAV9HX07_9PEZI|nr:hypothetical protein QBC42DRAFT_261640 [Cladorrhinum samala]